MNLVIVESPAKTKKLSQFLGEEYKVVSSVGHIRDLPKSELGVDVDKKYQPEYKVVEGKNKVVKELKKSAKSAKAIYLATDPDREGEAIAYHIAYILGYKKPQDPSDNLYRVTFNEITKEAVVSAVKDPREVDINLVDSQQARRILDRLVGYKLSPLLWKKIRYGLSAGRVQSVAVRFIVERERERENFEKKTYYTLGALLAKSKDLINSQLYSINDKKIEVKERFRLFAGDYTAARTTITEEKQLNKILKDLDGKQYKVIDVEKTESKRTPPPPFITSSLQQEAGWKLGISPKQTMRVAQRLYENGHITYMRTDSTTLSQTAIKQIRIFAQKTYGKEYVSPSSRQFSTKSKVAQEAHEAIRPTDVSKTPKILGLQPNEAKLYEIIWQRAVATQMADAIYDKTRVDILVEGKDKYVFRATGSVIKFDGFLRVYKNIGQEEVLPEVKEGDTLKLKELKPEEKQMQAPPRYTEASLVKELESFEIGRPSTYASIVDTIESRGYVELVERYLIPTDTGRVVNDLLSDHFEQIVDVNFTAGMEGDLDDIANGQKDWVKVLDNFYKPFTQVLKQAEGKIEKNDYTVLGEAPKDIKCPECGSPMVIKLSKNGKFYSCSKFPKCTGLRSIDGESMEDVENKAETDDFKAQYKSAPKTADGKDFVLKKGRFGEFWAHPDYPKVKEAKPLEYTKKYLKELYGESPKTDDGRDFLLKRGRFGEFWAHPDYPKVKETVRVKK